MPLKAGLIGLIPASIVVLFISLAIGATKWQYRYDDITEYIERERYGDLWEFCNRTTLTYSKTEGSGLVTVTVKETSPTSCDNVVDVFTERMVKYNNIVKNSLFSSLACIILASLGIFVKYFILKEWLHEQLQIRLGFLSAALAFISGCLAIVAFGMFNVEVRYESFSLHAGFYLTLTSGIVSYISGVLFLSSSICIGAKMYPDMS